MNSILVVDRNPEWVSMLSVLLSDRNYKVYSATETEQAEFYVRHHGLDMIISNTVDAFGKSRLEFLKAVRAKFPQIKIIVLTGNCRKEPFRPTVDLIIDKPGAPNTLFKIVESQLRAHPLLVMN